MRNPFDSYSAPENQLTHALAFALSEDKKLLRAFVRDVLKLRSAPSTLQVLTQQLPGKALTANCDPEGDSIPDIWLYSLDDSWCVILEAKITAALTQPQLESHRRIAIRLGFETVYVVALTGIEAHGALVKGLSHLHWVAVHRWLRSQEIGSRWAGLAADYIEILEAQMIEDETIGMEMLTAFSGIPFTSDNDYTYLQAKRVLNQALTALRSDYELTTRLSINPKLDGRGAITGSSAGFVWDYLRLAVSAERAHTDLPHFTLSLSREDCSVMVTLPNGLDRNLKKRFEHLSNEQFQRLCLEIVMMLESLLQLEPNAQPALRVLQRRYPSQRAIPFIDADLTVDLRTLTGDSLVKYRPQWIEAARLAYLDREPGNIQLQFGVIFPYARCPTIATPQALELFRLAWLGCAPLIDLLINEGTAR